MALSRSKLLFFFHAWSRFVSPWLSVFASLSPFHTQRKRSVAAAIFFFYCSSKRDSVLIELGKWDFLRKPLMTYA